MMEKIEVFRCSYYLFPYNNEKFTKWIIELENGFCIKKFQNEIKKILNEYDFEYMVWQEWKEGYARYIENLVRKKLGFNKINNLLKPPFNRECFYEIGSRLIGTLIEKDNKIDLNKLFYQLKNCE